MIEDYENLIRLPPLSELMTQLFLVMQSRGIKRYRLAKECGISKGALSRYANGSLLPKYETVRLMIDSIYTMAPQIEAPPPTVQSILDAKKIRKAVSVEENENISVAKDIMTKYNFSQLPVLHSRLHKGLAGLINDKSILTHPDAKSIGEALEGNKFAVMDPNEPAETARKLIEVRNTIIVLDQKERLLGILTMYDFLKWKEGSIR